MDILYGTSCTCLNDYQFQRVGDWKRKTYNINTTGGAQIVAPPVVFI